MGCIGTHPHAHPDTVTYIDIPPFGNVVHGVDTAPMSDGVQLFGPMLDGLDVGTFFSGEFLQCIQFRLCALHSVR